MKAQKFKRLVDQTIIKPVRRFDYLTVSQKRTAGLRACLSENMKAHKAKEPVGQIIIKPLTQKIRRPVSKKIYMLDSQKGVLVRKSDTC